MNSGLLIRMILFLGLAQNALAQEAQVRFIDYDGKKIEFKLYESLSPHNERQVIIEHKERRTLAPSTSVTVLVGRDLDHDGRFDAWFYLKSDGTMDSIDQPSDTQDGWDVAEKIIREHTQLKNRWYAGIMIGSFASNMTLTRGGNVSHILQKAAAEEIELLDLGVRADRIAKVNPRAPELLPIYEFLSDGWAGISNDMPSISDDVTYGLLQADIYAAGGVVIDWLCDLGPWVTSIVGDNKVFIAAKEITERFYAGIRERAQIALERVNFLKGLSHVLSARAIVVPYEMMKLSVKERVSVTIEALEARGVVGRLAAKTVLASKEYAHSAVKRLPYMALSQGLQLVSEIYDNRGVLFDKNPIIMSKRVVTDKDLLQDMAYMTMETAVTTTIIHRNGSGFAGYAKAGVFSMVDSNVMNYWIKGDTDLKRDALDTSWEVVIGNLQTVFDMRSLDYFERLSERSGNSKLRLVGYLVTGIDQFVGYVAYGKATKWYEDGKRKKEAQALKLTPILAPQY